MTILTPFNAYVPQERRIWNNHNCMQMQEARLQVLGQGVNRFMPEMLKWIETCQRDYSERKHNG
jgi:hypothetical protein